MIRVFISARSAYGNKFPNESVRIVRNKSSDEKNKPK